MLSSNCNAEDIFKRFSENAGKFLCLVAEEL